MKKSKTDILDLFNSIHKNEYCYEHFKNFIGYFNIKTKIKIKCLKHGYFVQRIEHHLNGSGCPKCSYVKLSQNKILNKEQFLAALKTRNKLDFEKLDFSLFVYKGTKIKGKVFCKDHGVFYSQPHNLLKGRSCPKCKKEILSRKNKTKHTLKEIAEDLNYENWEEIKKQYVKLNNIPTLSTQEKNIFKNYKNYNDNIISYYFLKKAFYLLLLNKQKKVIKKIKPSSIEIVSKITNCNKKATIIDVVDVENDHYSCAPTYMVAIYKCQECNKQFKVECNFAKWLKYFDGPTCKNCKKKTVVKTNTYKENYKNSMMKKYGVEFPYQSEIIECKRKQTMLERYGVEYSGQSRELLLKSWHNTEWKNKTSKQEKEIAKFVIEKITSQAKTVFSKEKPSIKIDKNKHLYPDIFIPEKNVIIEYYGDYWHCNPKLYSESYILPNKMSAKEKRIKDKKRIEKLKDLGYNVLVIWEYDWKNNKSKTRQQIKDFILNEN